MKRVQSSTFLELRYQKEDSTMQTLSNKPRARFEDPLSYFFSARTKLYTLWLSAIYPFVSIGRNLSIHYAIKLSRCVAHQIKLGSSVIIWEDVWLYVLPDSGNNIKITIDDNCSIGARSTISAKNCVHIEEDVIMATSVLIQDHNHAYEDISRSIRDQGVTVGGRIRIERGCWIGQGAAIVCNEGDVVIGRNSVIGANALVTRSCPPYSVIVGNPGRVAKRFDTTRGSWVGGETGRPMLTELIRQQFTQL
jgi:acetyltransferase-like isoleucine patch superfamily enzyme